MRDSLQFCRLCDSVLGRMLARHLSFISALWPESELREREREGEGGRDREMREGSLPTAPLAHWADAGVTEFDYRKI